MSKKKHIALRTCVICGNKVSKRSLIRIVAIPGDAVEMDISGKKPGRGAYVCADGNCVHRGIKRGRLEHALRMTIYEEDWEQLVSSLSGLNSTH